MYNGHKNWNHWNVSLWLSNDEGIYHFVNGCLRSSRTREEAARKIVAGLPSHTPDGAKYTRTSVRAALVGWV